MSPPEIWGPAVWTLFHTLIEKINPAAYNDVIPSMFGIIVQICKVLPCPDCSRDASSFLAKIHLRDYKTKLEFKNMLYLFHNWVNAKKRKPLYNYANMEKYANFNLVFVLKNFISKYNTKGNMKMLNESFQRSFVVKNLITWFKYYSIVFVQPTIIVNPKQIVQEEITNPEDTIENDNHVTEEKANMTEEFAPNDESIEALPIDDPPAINDDEALPIDDSSETNEESITNDNIIITDEVHSCEHKIDENVVIQEEVVIEEPIVIQQPKKKRTGKLKKKN